MEQTGKSRAAQLRDELEARAEQPPKRVRSFLTYLDRPGEVVEVPFTTAGDVMAAEEVLGEGIQPFMKLALQAKTEGWMVWKALSRHQVEAERPVMTFDLWRETVDQIWNESEGKEKDDPLEGAVKKLAAVSSSVA